MRKGGGGKLTMSPMMSATVRSDHGTWPRHCAAGKRPRTRGHCEPRGRCIGSGVRRRKIDKCPGGG
jgi:hypothetical protein